MENPISSPTLVLLRRTSCPENDIWIAALAHENNTVLCPDDLHFQHLPQVAILPPPPK